MPAPSPHDRRRLQLIIVLAEVVVAVATAVTVTVAYRQLDSNIEALPTIPHVAEPPAQAPEQPRSALNILVMGSDTRDGEGNAIDDQPGGSERSDVTILLHVSADREQAYGVSLPRDAMVGRPSCEGTDGQRLPPADPVIFNDAFSVGGPLCTVRQVEHITGIYVDHTVVVDFNGFVDMVDAVHGVEVCIPRDVVDPEHDINLAAGRRLVTGDEALDYVRERSYLSVNGDIGRMRRQQAFVASMVDRVISADTLATPTRLYNFLDAATGSLTLDEDLASLGALADLTAEFRGTDAADIKFVTVPIEAYAEDANRLQLAPPAQRLWELIAADRPLGPFARNAVTANDPVGKPDGDGDADREANGLCA